MPSNALELIAAAVEDKRPLRLANKLLCDTVDAKVRRARARTFSASFQTIARAPWNLRALNLTATDADDSGLALLALGDWKDLEELTVCLAPDQAVTQQQVRDTLTGWPKLHTLDLSCASIIRKELLAAIADAAPCLTHLAINDTLVTPEGFAALEGLGRVRTLKARLTGPGVRPLETMHDMQRLVLSGSPLAPEDLDIIAGAHFPELRALELERCGLAAAGTRALARGAWPHLERLVLKFNDVGPDLDHIASVCAHVTHLDLEDTRLEVIENLLNACKSIKKLVVSSNPIGAEGQQTIQSPTLEVLEMQDLDDDVDLGRMPNLHTLVMDGTEFHNGVLCAMTSWFDGQVLKMPPLLNKLSMKNTGLCCVAAGVLSTSVSPRMTELYLCGNPIGDAGAGAIAYASKWPELRVLQMHGCDVGKEGLSALWGGGYWPKMERISIVPVGGGGGGEVQPDDGMQSQFEEKWPNALVRAMF